MSVAARKIMVLTGTRADYGLLRKLMQTLDHTPGVQLETLVTGTHFAPEFGSTYREIERDELPITHRVDILPEGDTPAAVARATGKSLAAFADVFEASNPDLLVVLGDRYEALAAAEAAYLMNIPVAHIAGGEKTVGALDDALRHAITKLSSLHFAAADEYKNRVLQLGENPNMVFNVGAIGLDNFTDVNMMTKTELEEFVDFDLGEEPFILCTVHPETATGVDVSNFLKPLSKALVGFPQNKILITKANADAGGQLLNQLLEAFEAERRHQVKVVASLGQRGYLSAMELAGVVLGNSSSGILEAPSAGTPTVNIGDRQQGRLRAPSVIDVENSTDSIRDAIQRALSPEVQLTASRRESPFGAPGASATIAKMLAEVDLSTLLPKNFHDQTSGA